MSYFVASTNSCFTTSEPDMLCIFASSSPILFPCSRPPQAARPSWSPASNAAATFHPASRNSPFSPSPLSAPSAANCGDTFHLRSPSGDPTNWSPASSGLEAGSASEVECGLLTDDPKNILWLVAKNHPERHY